MDLALVTLLFLLNRNFCAGKTVAKKAFTGSKSTTETLQKDVKYVYS